jgi:alanyl-tRNA synthetase
MNQFKDIFLELRQAKETRVADSQKCLRVSGKHNDLEEVGKDTYHHTMFEMLGNWSFGDYFKKEAIEYAWEFLVEVMKIDKNRLYASVFEGDEKDNTAMDEEAKSYWLHYLPENHIIKGNKKDNFWEMGDTGPCGPCSEIHIDLRSEEERAKVPGDKLVNKDHPLVIEIWNLVFIQYNRKQDGMLEALPKKHVDTGMGFERLCMVVQNKKSNYDTDVFQPIIQTIARLSNQVYGNNEELDIAMRVIADHIRTIAFSIADGQLPSNEKAGYVIRRILRRAVRYAFTFLGQKQAFLYQLIPVLIKTMGKQYPEIAKQETLITKVTEEEENAFLRTLEIGIKLLDKEIESMQKSGQKSLSGKLAFTLYDAYGFPPDLTSLILEEKNLSFDQDGFDKEMLKQKERSRSAVKQETEEWIVIRETDEGKFIGYDHQEAKVRITRYRKAKLKSKEVFHLVFDQTPFYGESGGQVGDTGFIEAGDEKIFVVDTQKEHNLTIHTVTKLPAGIEAEFRAVVNTSRQQLTACNHSATHLLHFALREILGTHVEQKGSHVDEKRLRFDFTHFQKISDDDIQKIENRVNQLIRQNIPLDEFREISMEEALRMGAMALFGEKYGDKVRLIRFGDSVELCGGIHVKSTGEIGYFKILTEGGIAAGIRRIEAITAVESQRFIQEQMKLIKDIQAILKNKKSIIKGVEDILAENAGLQKQLKELKTEKIRNLEDELIHSVSGKNGIGLIIRKLNIDANSLKDLAFRLTQNRNSLLVVLAAVNNGKVALIVKSTDDLVKNERVHAGKLIREIAKEVRGGGGGQANFASAGGSYPEGIEKAFARLQELL